MVWCRHSVNIYFFLVDISQTEDYPLWEFALHLLLTSDRSCIGMDINQRLALPKLLILDMVQELQLPVIEKRSFDWLI